MCGEECDVVLGALWANRTLWVSGVLCKQYTISFDFNVLDGKIWDRTKKSSNVHKIESALLHRAFRKYYIMTMNSSCNIVFGKINY